MRSRHARAVDIRKHEGGVNSRPISFILFAENIRDGEGQILISSGKR